MRNNLTIATLLLAAPASAQQPAADWPLPPGRDAAGRHGEAADLALVLELSAAQRPTLDAYLAAAGPPIPPGPPPAEVGTGGERPPQAMVEMVVIGNADRWRRLRSRAS
ncbi:hypothetical protein SAMN05192583_3551 [Sphingomonas gellani]|uniref:Uncharacterized protein n=1 Tax=Sphingomonas gellani TaxID=1166340 RepID=A0A1H8JBX8_9SPHN|nr:hypothetical protein [Sphingomonas gellani]SEN77697.1 hypothetical protein SAMN05192583_3551 [Sphingomonas gellani]